MTGHRQADWPPITVHISPDGTDAQVRIAGVSHTVTADTLPGLRQKVRSLIGSRAAGPLGRPVHARIDEPDGTFEILITPDGNGIPPPPTSRRRRGRRGSRPPAVLGTTVAAADPVAVSGPLVVVVVNPHPGSRKTTNAILLAAALADTGRRTVLWDLADGATTNRTVHAMQPRPAAELYDTLHHQQDGNGEVGLARYLHPQPHGFALLPHPGNTIDPATVHQLHSLLTTSHECVVIDTGRPDQPAWAVALGLATRLVISTTTELADARTAYATLATVTEHGHTQLLADAITLVGVHRDAALSDILTITSGFRDATAGVRELPDDQALALPGPIRHDALATTTRHAWADIAAYLTRPATAATPARGPGGEPGTDVNDTLTPRLDLEPPPGTLVPPDLPPDLQ